MDSWLRRSRCSSRWMSNDWAPTFNLSRVPNEFVAEMTICSPFRRCETTMITEVQVRGVGAERECFSAARYTVSAVKILLLSTYELGRQPFGLASPAAWLRKQGHTVDCRDLSRQSLDEQSVREAQLVVFYLPMHTATLLALRWAQIVRAQNPAACLCACGLYAPLNESHLRAAGFSAILGPEFEADLAALAGG